MYKDFFNFRELPFKLVPNPAFMFLSRSHEEALAHLSYAVVQGDGFVKITGEVGTGKTTLCRSFLESLDQKFETAYVFNPKLDSIQLLKAVNDEFGIDSSPNSIKSLIDNLNEFLIIQKAAGKTALLLIDEAQNLSRPVLEQLRLLSNLETTQDKLLQIILVGQPELEETLDSHDLRQLGQRITLSCRLLPLTFRETAGYIKHRINIAACKVKTRFSLLALRAVYTYSGGIPRLINIACDRALLTAFTLDQKSVSWKAARYAIRELTRRERVKKKQFPPKTWVGLSFLLLLSAATLFYIYVSNHPGTTVWGPSSDKIIDNSLPIKIHPPLLPATPKPAPATMPPDTIGLPPPQTPAVSVVGTSAREKTESTTNPTTNEVPTTAAPLSPPDRQGIRDKFQGMNIFKSRDNALRTVLDLWQAHTKISPYPQRLADNYDFFRIAAEQNGFSLLRLKANLPLVKAFNLPAILELKPLAEAALRYSALVKIEAGGLCLRNGPGLEIITLKEKELEQYWTGMVYIPWKNFSNYTGVAPITSPPETILALKSHLKAMGFDKIPDNSDYDAVTRSAIQAIQKKNGLKPDGLVGPMTKIILYNQSEASERIPHLEGN